MSMLACNFNDNYICANGYFANYLFNYISGLTNLKGLQISCSKVTDNGIFHLKGMLLCQKTICNIFNILMINYAFIAFSLCFRSSQAFSVELGGMPSYCCMLGFSFRFTSLDIFGSINVFL